MSFIKLINKKYETKADVKSLIEYCVKQPFFIKYETFGTNCLNLEYALKSMYVRKKLFNKEDGQQIQHLVFSIKPEKSFCKSDLIIFSDQVMYEVGNHLADIGFQSIGFIHAKVNKIYADTESPNNVHIHFIVNNTNAIDGHNMRDIKNLLYSILYKLRKDPSLKFLNWRYVQLW